MEEKPGFQTYYAVIFVSTLKDKHDKSYYHMSEQMVAQAKKQPGFLGFDSARSEIGITVSYWKSLNAIKDWKTQTQHQIAQQLGKEKWYAHYHIRIAKVEREYHFNSL
ncbi:antibiotic biosynthesis monooxygenase [Mesonia sp. K7]|uniref:antibiotic biosynthesis monooxygenase family protein n=1 Tax=Mesonia sp. K7 TaxID=2218606 RepID=UPI000DA705A8|nr:antibiotic biosynthesis monooxygenase [Mesonia sp. K7]PZD77009.1 antibiotic biosynthesis monooxygenase [Mesonia sp. K7]